jgi:hypothetical protein
MNDSGMVGLGSSFMMAPLVFNADDFCQAM